MVWTFSSSKLACDKLHSIAIHQMKLYSKMRVRIGNEKVKCKRERGKGRMCHKSILGVLLIRMLEWEDIIFLGGLKVEMSQSYLVRKLKILSWDCNFMKSSRLCTFNGKHTVSFIAYIIKKNFSEFFLRKKHQEEDGKSLVSRTDKIVADYRSENLTFWF